MRVSVGRLLFLLINYIYAVGVLLGDILIFGSAGEGVERGPQYVNEFILCNLTFVDIITERFYPSGLMVFRVNPFPFPDL